MTAPAVARDDLRRMLTEDGHAGRGGAFHCPSPTHEDRHPSAQVFDDERGGHSHCFACGYHVTAVEYLVEHRGATMRQALEQLGLSDTRTGLPPARPLKPRARPPTGCGSNRPLRTLPDAFRKRYAERVELQTLEGRVPPALIGRGIHEEDISKLWLAEGDDGDGLFAIFGPAGELLNVKRRHAGKHANPRYAYEVAGNGSPAWCSPGILDADEVLVIEGELNGMACWLARPDLGVMGAAGANGCLHLEALKGKTTHIYADGDAAGDKARHRWADQARAAGAATVHVLDPWPDGDACDVAGRLSREHLRKRLT